MPVVSNTSPINYLVLIGAIEILPAIHQRVVIPVAVSEELRNSAAPDPVRRWTEKPPEWLEVCQPKVSLDEGLQQLGRGERDAIVLG
jgi:predicted nucleic acid-binding protein